MSADQILFFDNLNEISGGDDSFNKEMLALFCTSSKETLANMDLSIQKKDFESARTIWYQSSSIDNIFCDDIIQYILKFAGFYNTKGVSKKWKKHSDKNEENHVKRIYKTVEKSAT